MKLYSEAMQIMVYYKLYYNLKEWEKKTRFLKKIYHY